MLVATRDPFHDGEQKESRQAETPQAKVRPDRPVRPAGERFMGLLQMTGALLAIPIGLFTAYSLYRANFSVETTCQSLRAGIIATLDKSVDASARRMLVRRDVQTFEQTCAEIDPDATAAFKSLLAVDKAATAAAAAPAAGKTVTQPTAKAPVKAEPKADAKPVVKVDAKPEAKTEAKSEAKPEATGEAKAEAKPDIKPEPRPEAAARVTALPADAVAPGRPAESDANWLAAVRGALEEHPAPAVASQPAIAPPATPVAASAPATLGAPPAVLMAPGAAPPAVNPVAAAPALPPATEVPGTAAPRPAHPVPPGSIPQVSQPSEAAAAVDSRSRFGQLIGDIPLLGPVIAPKQD